MSSKEYKIESIPQTVSDSEMIVYLSSFEFGNKQIKFFKSLVKATDKLISEWFNISEKTFQNYKNSNSELSMNFKEKMLLLIALYNKGEFVFGSKEAFNSWLEIPNFQFNNKAPVEYFKSISGIRFIEDRLTGIEYGDNA